MLVPESISIWQKGENITAYCICSKMRICPDGDDDIAKILGIDKKYYRKLMKKFNGVLTKHLMVYFLNKEDCERAINFIHETFGLAHNLAGNRVDI